MIGIMPKFYESEYFVPEVGNWHLKPGAPKEIKDEFNTYMKEHKKFEAEMEKAAQKK